MGGGGLLVAKTGTTPMTIVGEYSNEVLNGAGCAGAQSGDLMWLNSGVSASGAGATQSTFTMYTLDDTAFEQTNRENSPAPILAFKDASNTNTIGNLDGTITSNLTGQVPGVTTRRDAHGAAVTTNKKWVHNVDRIQNLVEVFNTTTYARNTYDLSSADGQGNRFGAWLDKSV